MTHAGPTDYAEQLKRALVGLKELRARAEAAESAGREMVAVIGLGMRFPGGVQDPEGLWRLLSDGVDAVTEVPPDRWSLAEYYDADPDAPGKILTRCGGFLEDVDKFDAGLFNVSPREAVAMDPQQRLLLEVAWTALENAGIAPDSLADTRTGVYVGIGSHDYLERLLSAGPEGIDSYVGSGNAHSVAAGRLSYTLGLQGPCLALDTACSSSLVAVHLACQGLRAGECALAIAGGVNLILSPTISINHSRARMLAPDGRCKAFAAAADGFVRSEGCGLVVLKRLSDARRDGDRVLAVLRGSASNQDGRTSGLTVPNGPAQQAVIRAALAQAGLQPSDVGYLEAHGTGTALGDPIEMGALAAVFGPGRRTEAPLYVGSVKTNLGHCESAAGVAGLIKAILSVNRGLIPPHLHFTRPNPLIPWDENPWVRIPTEETPWPSTVSRVAGVSSFGFGGTNAHIIVSEPPRLDVSAVHERSGEVLVLAAKTEAALRSLAGRYVSYFSRSGPVRWPDVCHAAATGRASLPHRLVVTGASPIEASGKLAAFAAGAASRECWSGVVSGPPKVAFLFSGQGSPYEGMGRELLATNKVFREAFAECGALVRKHAAWELAPVIESADKLAQTEFGQVALFAVEYALCRLWASWGVKPDVVIGHSVGEYAAACAVGVLPLDVALPVLIARAQLMGALGEHGAMAAVHGSVHDVAAVLAKHGVEIAAVNSPKQVVITGRGAAVHAAVDDLKKGGLKAVILDVRQGYHSRQMEPMLEDFERRAAAALAAVRPADVASARMISTVTGLAVADELATASYWVRQARSPVLFAEAMRALHAERIDLVLEMGPRGTLVSLGQQNWPDAAGEWLLSLRPGRNGWAQMVESAGRAWAQGAPVAWSEVYSGFSRPSADLPSYPFQGQRFWCAGAARPGQRLQCTYEIKWEAVTLGAPAAVPARWLLAGGTAGWRAELAAELKRRGAEVVQEGQIDAVAFLQNEYEVQDPARAACADCERLRVLTQDMLRTGARARLWVITRGAVAAVAGDDIRQAPASAPVLAFTRAFALEHPELVGGTIDLSATRDARDAEKVVDAAAAEAMEDRLAWHGRGWLGARLLPLNLPAASAEIRENGSYLITGGLGALGLSVAEWLVKKGARSLVLCSRGKAATAAETVVARLRDSGADVVIRSADVADTGALRRLLDEIASSRPPLCGIVHAAGVAGDAPVEDLTQEALANVLRPKVAGAWALHECTLGMDLDFFTMFSSIAGVWGSKGQAHYGAANSFLDALSLHRRTLGLPALSIAWGPWAAGGMATENALAQLSRVGVQALETGAALEVLERAIGSSVSVVVAAQVDWPQFRSLVESRRPGSLMAHLSEESANHPKANVLRALRSELDTLGSQSGTGMLKDFVEITVAGVLRLQEGNRPEPRQGFSDMGIDSLMAIEIRNRVGAGLGLSLAATLVFNYPNIELLTRHLGALIWPHPGPKVSAGTSEQARIESMSEAEAEALLLRKIEEM